MDAALYLTLMSGGTSAPPTGALALLADYDDGMAFLAVNGDGRGQVAVKDSGTPANDLSNVAAADLFTDLTTSPTMTRQSDGSWAWSPHNLFVNPTAPATQNVTLITGATYTVTVTGAGSLAGSSGASGTATDGSSVTFTATGTTGTFTLTGSLDTIQINRGSVATSFVDGGASAGFEPAFEWDPRYGGSGGWRLRLENAGTNLLVESLDLSDAAWTKTFVSESSSGESAPDGTSTAWTLTDTADNDQHSASDGITASANAWIYVSAFVKPGTHDYAYLSLAGATANNYATAAFDLSNASADAASETDAGSSSGTVGVTRQTADATGWVRIEAMLRVNEANPVFHVGFGEAATGNTFDTAGNPTYAGSGTTMHVWQSQAEVLTFLSAILGSSPIFTHGSTVTRSAKYLKATALPFAASGTFLFKGELVNSSQYLFALSDGSFGDRHHVLNSTGSAVYSAAAGFAAQVNATLGSLNFTAQTGVAIGFDTNDCAGSLDGATAITDASATMPTLDTLYIAASPAGAGTKIDGYLDELLFLPGVRKPDAELEALAA